ncbi:hypothetical protein LTR86_005041 [Recurvomyces mirabilis]|nr:hypothetical protein LTR86_005041 [Recurvomyces mirabilis]
MPSVSTNTRPTPLSAASSLEDTIATASADRPRAVLLQICRDNAEAEDIAQTSLLITHASGLTLKRARTAWQSMMSLAIVLAIAFTIEVGYHTNSGLVNSTECAYTGKKKVDYQSDFWADHDDDCHGDPETLHDEPDYADGFIWTCCDGVGDVPGCVVTVHNAVRTPKRARR